MDGRARVLRAIEILQNAGEAGPELRLEDDRVLLEGVGEGTVWCAAYDRAHEVRIERGENRGRTLRYRNVVRAVVPLGSWRGVEATFELPRALREGHDGLAVWLERADGAILASATAETSGP